MRISHRGAIFLALTVAMSGCAGGTSTSDSSSAGGPSGSSTAGPDAGSPSPSDRETSAMATTSTGKKPSSTPGGSTCADTVMERLTDDQKLGQLVMVGLQSGTPTDTVSSLVRDQHVGNVIYLGGWEGSSTIRTTSATLQRQVSESATGGVKLLIAADQEGGQVWQIRGTGPERLPSALDQGKSSSEQRVTYGKQIGGLLRDVGINLNLAPVADTVPPELGTANEPIGKWGRQYAQDPQGVSAAVPDLIKGLHQGGVAATLKHFPGIGRIRGNTDFTATGIDDPQMTEDDPYLAPFRSGIRAGTDLVMVSSARYPKIDPENLALFSPAVIDDLLRKSLGYEGVVVTDDIAAAAVRAVPPGERATRFVEAGGDILLTGQTADVQPMLNALKTKAADDPAFQKRVDAAVRRVVELKVARGLADCAD